MAKKEFEPTPSEIAEACDEIQSTWSESERLSRTRGYVTCRYSAEDVERLAKHGIGLTLMRRREELRDVAALHA